ncbi:efflux RND transporter periplasmic adaptor subunit [Bacteroidota bacterium]
MDKKIEKKKWPPKKIAAVAGSALFIFMVLYIFVFGDKSSKLNVEKDRITISTVDYGPFQEFIAVTGTVQPIETFFLDVTEGGTVVTKFVEEGAHVEVGDPIIKLDNAQLTLSIIYNEANVFQQINNLRSARLAFEQSLLSLNRQLLDLDYRILNQERLFKTNQKLYEKNLISQIEYENSNDEYEYLVKSRELTYRTYYQDSLSRSGQIASLEFSTETLENNLQVTKQQLENLTVKAPIKGQLTRLTAEIGQSISQGENLGQIDDTESFRVRVAVDEYFIDRVSVGQGGEFTFSGDEYQLVISTVFPEVSNGRFQVDMLFVGEAPRGIRRGQTLHIKLELGELSDATLVDRGGFYQTTGGQWIFVLNSSESEAVRRPIKLGRQNPQVFEVLDGLAEGEKVVTSSYDNYGDIEKLIIN